jgi:UDP-glucoronosyl and UDP-glucosyl transferase
MGTPVSPTEVFCQAARFRDRIAVICLVPDPGHMIPLLKIAEQVREACDVLVLVPDELLDIVAYYGFRAAGIGSVRPTDGLWELQRYINASEWFRITSAFSACEARYFDVLNDNITRSLNRLDENLSQYRPTCLLVDDQWDSKELNELLLAIKVPIFFHTIAPNYRGHNTWSFQHCCWTDYRGAVADAIVKTKNEVRLWAKQLSPRGKSAEIPVDSTPAQSTINRLSTGTSFLERALLNDRLLYTGNGRLVLPAIPPLGAPLSQGLHDWLEQFSGGDVVYISFGTMVQPDSAMVTNIVRAILEEGKGVLLQYFEELPAILGVRQERWVAQATVLSHPAISLFVTHGGQGSVEEALWHGKPMLCIPWVWDQHYNSWIVELLGAGRTLPRHHLGSPKRISKSVQRAMLHKHADNARLARDLMWKRWTENRIGVINLFRSSSTSVRG